MLVLLPPALSSPVLFQLGPKMPKSGHGIFYKAILYLLYVFNNFDA